MSSLQDNGLNGQAPQEAAGTGGEYLSGYLLKKSSKGEWNKQYFEVNGDYLVSFKSAKMTKMNQAISIPSIAAIHMSDQTTGQNKNKASLTFQLDLKDKQIILRSQTEEDAKNWVRVLQSIRERSAAASMNPLNNNDTRSFSMSQTPNILYMNAVGRESTSTSTGRRSSGTSLASGSMYSRNSSMSSVGTPASRHYSMGSVGSGSLMAVRGSNNSNNGNNGNNGSNNNLQSLNNSSNNNNNNNGDQNLKMDATQTILEGDEECSTKGTGCINSGDPKDDNVGKEDRKDAKSGCCCVIS